MHVIRLPLRHRQALAESLKRSETTEVNNAQPGGDLEAGTAALQGGAMPSQPPHRTPSKRGPPPEQPAAQLDMLALQRGRFVKWQPSPVLCGAVTGDGTVAAVGREDGQIELWDTLSWQLLKVGRRACRRLLSPLVRDCSCIRQVCLSQTPCACGGLAAAVVGAHVFGRPQHHARD